jgi:hypothetical protein
MFAYPCPSCHQRLLAPAERAGQRTICPKCLKPLTVPTSDARSDAFGSMADIETPDPVEVHLSNPNQRNVETPEPMATVAPMMLEDPISDEAQYDLDLSIKLEAPVNAQANGSVAVKELPVATMKSKLSTVAPLSPAMQPAATPAPASQRYNTRKPLTQDRHGQVHLFSNQFGNVDVAAELSAAISMRMAPPPEPPLDPRFMYAGWFAGVALGVSAWLLSVLSSNTWLPYVALSGGAMVVFGLLWRAYLSSRNGNWLTGLATILPPVCIVQLLRPAGQHGRKPLAFVIAGTALVGLFFVGPQAKAYVDANIGEKATDFKITPKLSIENTVAYYQQASAEEQADLLKALHEEVTSSSSTTRTKALETLLKVTPAEAIPILVAKLGEPDDREFARTLLQQLGTAAEPCVLKLLGGSFDSQQLVACGLLEKIGTAQSYQVLRDLTEATTSRAVRVEAALAADAIAKRIDAK